MFSDLRYAWRSWLKTPTFAVVAIFTLALGIGATTAIFSVVDTILLRRLPYRDADRIVTLWQTSPDAGAKPDDVAPANFLDWREQARTFEAMAGLVPFGFDYTGEGEPETFPAILPTEGFFDVVGIRPLLGRTFLPEDHQKGRNTVVLLGHGVWQSRFGADRQIVGRKLMLDNTPYTVIGVLPPSFKLRLLDMVAERALWAPKVIAEHDKLVRGTAWWNVVGRLRRDVTATQAHAEMSGIAARLAREHPRTNAKVGVVIQPLKEHLVGEIRPALVMLLGAVALVLLIACANVANLLLARCAERERELAVRAALGAGRRRLLRQLLTESLLLAILGCTGGLLVAYWGIDLIAGLSPGEISRMDEAGIDLRVLGFAVALSFLTAMAFGMAPAWQLSKPDLHNWMKQSGRSATAGRRHARFRGVLVVSEVAFALLLLIGAGLFIRSLVTLLRVDPGFERENVLAAQVFAWDRYTTPERRATFFAQVLDRMKTLPGVRAAGAVSAFPFIDADINYQGSFTIEGKPPLDPGQEPRISLTIAASDYFQAMGIPLYAGRRFQVLDTAQSPRVALITDGLARRYFANENPLGKKITTRWEGKPLTAEIVGVVGEVRHERLDKGPRMEVFFPHSQAPFGSMTFVVRTEGGSATALQSLREQIWTIDRNQAIYDSATLEQLVLDSVADRRFVLVLLGTFALIALALSAIGIYGLINYLTSERTQEIGVRMALGAGRRDILDLVIRRGVTLALLGVACGIGAALVLTRYLQTLLFGVTPTDPMTFVTLSALIILVATLASYIPARRATRVDPVVALRVD